MKKYTIGLLLLVFLFTGCIHDADPIHNVTTKQVQLSDSRFNGDFVYSDYWTATDGINEVNEYYSYDFDGTNNV